MDEWSFKSYTINCGVPQGLILGVILLTFTCCGFHQEQQLFYCSTINVTETQRDKLSAKLQILALQPLSAS